MTIQTLTQAGAVRGTGFGHKLNRLAHHWCLRRRVARLQGFDDHILRDIGVTREDIRWAASLPLSVNAALALEDRALRKRASVNLW